MAPYVTLYTVPYAEMDGIHRLATTPNTEFPNAAQQRAMDCTNYAKIITSPIQIRTLDKNKPLALSFFTDETSKGWGRTSLDALWSPKTLHPSHNGKKSYDVSWELCLCFEPGEKRIVSYVRVRNAYLGLQQQVPTENGHRVEQVLCVCPCSSLSSKLVSFPFDSVLSEAFFLEQKAEQKIYSLEKRLEDGRENPSLSIKV
jgi:hypothetical protein